MRAQMVCRGAWWRLYVVVLGSQAPWPTYTFAGGAVPTVQERSQALASLGYAVTDGGEWSWGEDQEQADDPASPVLLIAATDVAPAGRGAA
ncbi:MULTISPECIES: DUF6303 family protein [unclassified Streptomyces]|uniref:DUF6303 family protein n=1 Tax=unclassified Streptomyces TaxID=2593676 RepID=UPI0033297A25